MAAKKRKSGPGKKKPPKAAPSQTSDKPSRVWLIVGGLLVVAVAVALAQPRTGGEASAEDEVTETVDLVDRTMGTTIPEALTVRIVQRYPHASDAFTQGLLWHDGKLFESTGLHGRSSLRRVNLEDGEVEQKIDVDRELFAEGLARVGDELFQLTWQSGIALVYDLETFEKKRELQYEGEGWGLCYDGEHLVMSDGSARLTFRNPRTFEVAREVQVTKASRPLRHLNELECVDGSVYANVWQTTEIVRIDPQNGRVTASIQTGQLLTPAERRQVDVLNGIAWIPERRRFVITGKEWPTLFEVELVPRT